MVSNMNTSMEVGEYFLRDGTLHVDTKNLPLGSDTSENPSHSLQASNGIESATNSEIADALTDDFCLPLPDSDQVPVSMQFAIVPPKSKRMPRDVDSARGLTLFAAVLMVLFACVVAMLGGLLTALATAEPSLSKSPSKVDAWNAAPITVALPAKGIADATLTTPSSVTHKTAVAAFFVADDAGMPGADVVWEIERDALGVPFIENDQWRASEEKITADNEHVRSLLGLSTKRVDSITPGRDANLGLMFASPPIESVSPDRAWPPIEASLEVPQVASAGLESPNLWVVQDNYGFGTIAVLPVNQSANVSIHEPLSEASAPIEASVVVDLVVPKITLGFAEFHQIHTRDRKGVELRFEISVDRYLGDQLEIGAYFFDANGIALKDRDAMYVSERGNVYTKQLLTIESGRYDNNAFTLFLPYLQFDALPGGTHQLQAQIFVWTGPRFQERLAIGARQEFELTLYKFVARSR